MSILYNAKEEIERMKYEAIKAANHEAMLKGRRGIEIKEDKIKHISEQIYNEIGLQGLSLGDLNDMTNIGYERLCSILSGRIGISSEELNLIEKALSIEIDRSKMEVMKYRII